MGHANKPTLVRQIHLNLTEKIAFGDSKHQDKLDGTDRSSKIYSYSTLKSYMKHSNYFAKYCKEKYNCKTLEQCRPYANEWIKMRNDSNLSAYTVKLDVAAICKLYNETASNFVETRSRERGNITRSRSDAARDKHFSKTKNADLIKFCKSTGLRRSELKALTGDKLLEKNGNFYIKVDVGTKGGRYRESQIIGSAADIKKVTELMRDAGFDKVFPKISTNADIHGYRATYAKAFYEEIARPINEIPFDRIHKATKVPYQSDVYICRNDLAGIKFDKKAMQIVSKNLGHNRISVIASNYLYK